MLRSNALDSVEFLARLPDLQSFDAFGNDLVTEPPSQWPANLMVLDIRETGLTAEVLPQLPEKLQRLAIDRKLVTEKSKCTLVKRLSQLTELMLDDQSLSGNSLSRFREKC